MTNNYNHQIQQYATLLEQGVITQEEYDIKVRQITAQYRQQQAQSQQNNYQQDDYQYGYSQTQYGHPQQQYQYQQYQQPYVTEPAKPSFGWAILCFFIPLVGLILFLAWKGSKPKTAKLCGIAALVGFILGIIGQVFLIIVGLYTESMYGTMY